MRRTNSTLPIVRYRRIAAALFSYFWLANCSAFGASTEPARGRPAVWVGAALALAGAALMMDRRLAVRARRPNPGLAREFAETFFPIREQADDQPSFRIVCEGPLRPLDPAVEDEIYRIGREGVLNALRHSRARNIEIALTFRPDSLRMVVRDDGCGITSDLFAPGGDAYRGLACMRDRAERIGGRLRLLSAPQRGTELELSVPGVFRVYAPETASAGKNVCTAAS